MSENNRVLIVDRMHESILPLLKGANLEPDYRPEITRDAILSCISEFIGLIIRSKTEVDKELLDAGSNLKFVSRAGAGMDKVDRNYLEKRNIQAINAPEGNRDSLGEHTLGMLLGLLHKINVADNQVKHKIWRREENRGLELKGKVVGIYGYGHMGEAFAKKMVGLDCKILAYDKYKRDFSSDLAKGVDLHTFREQTEILSIHIPLKDETKYLFDYENLTRYPKLKIILNTARGEILKLLDAVRLVEEGRIIGLGLDVLENEKFSTYSTEEKSVFLRLKKLPNVILTPHVGGWTYESYERINNVILEKIKNFGMT